MQWYSQNPEVARPIAVCLLLLGGAVFAEAIVPTGTQTASVDAAVYEVQVKLDRSATATTGSIESETTSGPYFDLDDPQD